MTKYSSTTLLLIFLALGGGAQATTVVIDASEDTSLYQNHPDSNLGGTTLVAGTNQQFSNSRALIKFDVSSIPAGAVITSVLVTLTVTRQPDPDQHGGPVNSDFSLYRVLTGWGEGTGNSVTGSPAMAGDATWNESQFGSTSWTIPGGQIGADYENDPSASTSVGGLGTYTWGSSTGLVDDVQSWLDDLSTNFGLMLLSEAEGVPGSARRFASKESPGGAVLPPEISITYTTAPEPSISVLLTLAVMRLAMVRRRSDSGRRARATS